MDRLDVLQLLLRHTPARSEDERKGVRGLRWRLQEGSWHKWGHFNRSGKGGLWRWPTVHKWVLILHGRDDTILSAPFIFGPWISTPYCNASCGTNRFKLELRTCTPISPNLPANISCQNETTLKAGNSMCININCTGKIEHIWKLNQICWCDISFRWRRAVVIVEWLWSKLQPEPPGLQEPGLCHSYLQIAPCCPLLSLLCFAMYYGLCFFECSSMHFCWSKITAELNLHWVRYVLRRESSTTIQISTWLLLLSKMQKKTVPPWFLLGPPWLSMWVIFWWPGCSQQVLLIADQN